MTTHRFLYVPALSAAITLGRSNSSVKSGSGSSQSIGWASGGAAANGTWLVLAIIDNETGNYTPSGGTAWTRLGSTKIWYKQCGASEPTTYSVTYDGGSKNSAGAMVIQEILGATSVDASASTTSSGTTSPAVTVTGSADLVVLAAVATGQSANPPSAPSGYTLRASNTPTGSATVLAAIATKAGVGAGTETPGAWGNSWNQLGTIAFK